MNQKQAGIGNQLTEGAAAAELKVEIRDLHSGIEEAINQFHGAADRLKGEIPEPNGFVAGLGTSKGSGAASSGSASSVDFQS